MALAAEWSGSEGAKLDIGKPGQKQLPELWQQEWPGKRGTSSRDIMEEELTRLSVQLHV